MRAVDIIIKKRDGYELLADELNFFIQGFSNGEIPDYQAAAWAMAVLFNGMSNREIVDLTMAIVNSGDTINLSGVIPYVVDKHSTGGVGDKTTLVVAPIVAACGLPIGKMSGRGLGFSGGTLDKLESIPGFQTHLSIQQFMAQLKEVGIVVCSQTSDLAPADGKLYALRDVTGTVQSIPLIASSIMSKKIAAGAQAILLDVKIGQGAFMETLEEGRHLAEVMVSIARSTGRKAIALLSDMNQPLGCAVGNAIEVKEAIQTMHNQGPVDFHEHCLRVAGHMLALAGISTNEEQGYFLAEKSLLDGRAWEKFLAFITAQSGDIQSVLNPERLPSGKYTIDIVAFEDGFIEDVQAKLIGETAVLLGAGRAVKGDKIDYGVGITVHKKVGNHICKGDLLFQIIANNRDNLDIVKERMRAAIKITDHPVSPYPLFYGVVR